MKDDGRKGRRDERTKGILSRVPRVTIIHSRRGNTYFHFLFSSRSLSLCRDHPLLLRTLAYACHGLPCSLCTLTAHLSTYLPTRTAMVNTFLCFSYPSFQTYPTTPISRSPAPILHSLALATHSSSSSSRLNSFRSLSSSPVSLFVNVNKVPLTPQIRLSPVSYRP
jgi:hypothetical protein